MDTDPPEPDPLKDSGPAGLPRNVWAVSLTSFLTDVSSGMVINMPPLFLFNVLGVRTAPIGLIEGVAEALASLLKLFSGWFSDVIGKRKLLVVGGYGFSAFSKPYYVLVTSWPSVALVRWTDRVGKGSVPGLAGDLPRHLPRGLHSPWSQRPHSPFGSQRLAVNHQTSPSPSRSPLKMNSMCSGRLLLYKQV